jgi:hypothetical protein
VAVIEGGIPGFNPSRFTDRRPGLVNVGAPPGFIGSELNGVAGIDGEDWRKIAGKVPVQVFSVRL